MMKKRKLQSASKTRAVRKTGAAKQKQAASYRRRKTAVKRANKVYYKKNRAQILRRAAARRARYAHGDHRTTRRASMGVTTRRTSTGKRMK